MLIRSLILTLSFLGFVGCSQTKETDKALNGVWEASITDPATQEKITYLYEFDNESVRVVESNDSDTFQNGIQFKSGTYKRDIDKDLQRLTFVFSTDSCASGQVLSDVESLTYEFVENFDQVEFSYGLNKKVTFRRLTQEEVLHKDDILETATIGCYTTDAQGRRIFQRTL